MVITFKDGTSYVWEKECYTNCEYACGAFLVYKCGRIVGVYNLDCIVSVVVK